MDQAKVDYWRNKHVERITAALGGERVTWESRRGAIEALLITAATLFALENGVPYEADPGRVLGAAAWNGMVAWVDAARESN